MARLWESGSGLHSISGIVELAEPFAPLDASPFPGNNDDRLAITIDGVVYDFRAFQRAKVNTEHEGHDVSWLDRTITPPVIRCGCEGHYTEGNPIVAVGEDGEGPSMTISDPRRGLGE